MPMNSMLCVTSPKVKIYIIEWNFFILKKTKIMLEAFYKTLPLYLRFDYCTS